MCGDVTVNCAALTFCGRGAAPCEAPGDSWSSSLGCEGAGSPLECPHCLQHLKLQHSTSAHIFSGIMSNNIKQSYKEVCRGLLSAKSILTLYYADIISHTISPL